MGSAISDYEFWHMWLYSYSGLTVDSGWKLEVTVFVDCLQDSCISSGRSPSFDDQLLIPT